jgi:hypothetical protein
MSPVYTKGGLRGIFARTVEPCVAAESSPNRSFTKRGNPKIPLLWEKVLEIC